MINVGGIKKRYAFVNFKNEKVADNAVKENQEVKIKVMSLKLNTQVSILITNF